MGKAGLAEGKVCRGRLKAERIPVAEQLICIHAAPSGCQIVSRTGVIAERVITVGIVIGSAERAIRTALLAGHDVASHRDIVKGRRMLCRQGIENEVCLSLRPVFLVD